MKRLLKKAETVWDYQAEQDISDYIYDNIAQNMNYMIETQPDEAIQVKVTSEVQLSQEQAVELEQSPYELENLKNLLGFEITSDRLFQYPQGDINAGYFAIISASPQSLIAQLSSSSSYVGEHEVYTYVHETIFYYENILTFPNIEEFQGACGMENYNASPGMDHPGLQKFEPVPFDDMQNEKTFEELKHNGYFGDKQITFEQVKQFMNDINNDVDKIVNLVHGSLEKPPLFWVNDPNTSSIAFSTALMGTSGIAINTRDSFMDDPKERFTIIAHELAHEIDGQNDLTMLSPNRKGEPTGDQQLINYLSDKSKVDHDFSDWEDFYSGDEDEVQTKLLESFADLFAKWATNHVYGDRIKKADEEVMRYLDYLFGYMNWASDDGDLSNDPDKTLYQKDTFRRFIEEYRSAFVDEIKGLGGNPNNLEISVNMSQAQPELIFSSKDPELVKLMRQNNWESELQTWIDGTFPGTKVLIQDQPGEIRIARRKYLIKKVG